MVYKWSIKDTKVDPNEAGKLIEELGKTGEVTPKRLLDISRDEGALLHNEFEWDDSVAAENYRESQARHIITNLRVVSDENEPVKAFVSLSSRPFKGEGYESIFTVMSDDEKRKQLLNKAKYDMKLFKAKYKALKELSEVIAAMDKVQ